MTQFILNEQGDATCAEKLGLNNLVIRLGLGSSVVHKSARTPGGIRWIWDSAALLAREDATLAFRSGIDKFSDMKTSSAT
jgi:hypothetical protein